MSIIKPSPIVKGNKIIFSNIMSRCAYFGCMTETKARAKIGMSKNTFARRKKIGRWESDELFWAADVLKVPVTWFFEDHSKVEEVKQ